ncbi:phosphoribosyltransferase family protein [Phyllobacterium sp. 0TCS1.6C]|uniref:phosphoribosyltransferase family protein n=1 Tax=unclassified Phyllobacterium TaxID=2638441 RepID=UPI0022649DAA|nr:MULTISPECIES: phosphoribosyltransferase family protein [unclassified Phyllobacterium]MCX8278939.1 phosphoribosyltransferase family protein [Phyllobacterium sp. 0TCS1.6C]MCX8293723.1 phosphoribosyltransferase family protein [Phyllobacterium sp. 0TCS1.6A]
MTITESISPHTGKKWRVDVSGFDVELPIVAIKPDFAISLMMVIDLGIKFGEHVGKKLAERLAPLQPEVIVGAATLGIPVAMEVSRALGLDQYVILQKSPKIHLGDALVQPISSITSKGEQKLLLDRQSIPLLEGRRTVVVDDVVASGSSLKGSIQLARAAGANVVGVGLILTEANEWKSVLGADADLVHSLAHIPQFKQGTMGWEPIPETL